jgi:catechol 2,3-dioxygenase-like lactoylglutathione lyase family enzyme
MRILPPPFLASTVALLALAVLATTGPARAQIAPVNAAGLTYGHVHLNVSDLEAHKVFWAEYFGGKPVRRGAVTAIRFPSLLLLLDRQPPTAGSQGTVMDHVGFKVRDLPGFLAKWRAAGLVVQSEFTGMEGFPNAYIVGPDGVRIELQEDKTLTQAAVGHHIHFMAANHEPLMAWYVQTFGLEPFQRGRIPTTANAPGMNLTFHPARTPTVATRGRAIDHIGFEFTDLEAAVRQLKARGTAIDTPIRNVPGGRLKSAFITDPSGVRIELTQGLSTY